METSLKTGFAQIFSRCPKNLSSQTLGGPAAPLAPPARTPMSVSVMFIKRLRNFNNTEQLIGIHVYLHVVLFHKYGYYFQALLSS